MRIIIGGLTVLAILMVGALVAPQFVDWNKYKPQIVSQVEKSTGLKVDIAGDLSMSVLPVPHVKIEQLTINAPQKKEFENLLTMKSAEVSVELMPLLSKEIKVSSVTLVEPDIKVEILSDGTPSWETEQLKGNAQKEKEQDNSQTNEAPSNKLESVALDKLEIQGGKVVFVNHKTGARHAVNDLNTTLRANSLMGPFSGQGDLVYNKGKFNFDVSSGKFPKEGALPIKAKIGVPAAEGKISFDGVVALKAPIDVQGQTSISTQSIGDLISAITGKPSNGLNEDLGIEGLISANENNVKFDNLKVSTGDFIGNGKIAVQNLKSQNPLLISGDIQSSNVLNLNPFLGKSSSQQSTLKKSTDGKAASNKEIVPSSLTLPMDIDANVKLDVAGLRFQKNNLRGVFVDLNKKSGDIKAAFKIVEMAGQSKASGNLSIAYGSESKSPKTGQVTYSDPKVAYKVDGQIGQLAAFLNEFAPAADTKALTKLYSNAQFNLDGSLSNGAITLKDSTVKLNDLVVGLSGKYVPETQSKRAKAVIEARADSINFDAIMGKSSAGGAGAGNKAAQSSGNKSKMLDPLRQLSLPLDLDFDISLQKARINGADLSGLRLDGKIFPNAITLDTVSVKNYVGAALSLKGGISNLDKLSGLDLTGYIKTDDLKSFAKTLQVDVSKLPANVNKLEASVEGKGAIEAMSFAANVKALGGSLDANGQVQNILGTPAFDGLALRVKHSNANTAIKSVSPKFKGNDALNQAIDFYSKVNSSGKVYDLSDMKVALGKTNFTGNLKVDTGNKIIGVSGDINAGKIALDSLLGAKTAATSAGGSSSSGSKGKWSDKPIDLSFMNTTNINVNLSAQNLTYGKWSFSNPSTALKIANGVMNVNGLKAGVFGGNATLNTKVTANPVTIDLSSNMSSIDLEKLAGALSNSNKLKTRGDVSFGVDVKGSGESSRALISSLNGSSNVNGTNITIQGFDLAKLAQGLNTEQKFASSLQNFATGALKGGETVFDTLKGDYAITNGIVNITSMALDGKSSTITSTGKVDLPKWFINVNNSVALKNVEGFDPVNVQIKGSLNNPATLGKNILEDYIQDKLKRKITKELPGLLGDDVTEKLQKFGIVPGADGASVKPSLEGLVDGLLKPKSEKKPEVIEEIKPAPNTESVAPEEAAPEAVEKKPQPAPKKEKPKPTPEDAVEKLLKGGDPEEAVNDLIKGLF